MRPIKAAKRENTKGSGRSYFGTLKIFTNKQVLIKAASETLMSSQTISNKENNTIKHKNIEKNRKIISNPKNSIISIGDGIDAQAREIHTQAHGCRAGPQEAAPWSREAGA
jgi:single-stranded DNA-specific DHH superfamily exonuclease